MASFFKFLILEIFSPEQEKVANLLNYIHSTTPNFYPNPNFQNSVGSLLQVQATMVHHKITFCSSWSILVHLIFIKDNVLCQMEHVQFYDNREGKRVIFVAFSTVSFTSSVFGIFPNAGANLEALTLFLKPFYFLFVFIFTF